MMRYAKIFSLPLVGAECPTVFWGRGRKGVPGHPGER